MMNKVKYRLIDLSHHNGKVDFKKVKAAGIDGVILRTGYGVKSPSQKDRRFEEYYAGARAAGLLVGAYHYSYAKNAEGAVKEAEFMLEIMKGKQFDFPVYGDFEEQGSLSKKECCEMVTAFCKRLEAAGAWAGIYSYDSFFKEKLTPDIPERFTVWVARVENVFPRFVPENEVAIWQYSWKGNIDGISGNVDTDHCYRDFPSMMKKAKKNIF